MPTDWPTSRPPQSPPEILPPEDGTYRGEYPNGPVRGYSEVPSPLPQMAQRNRWATAPATYTLVGINCVVYLGMVLSGVSATNPSVQELVRWGANFGGYVLAGQWWRLLTAGFGHVGIFH